MPNILLVVPRFNIGGAESYVLTVALGLKSRGYHVAVASWGGRLINTLSRAEIPHYHVPIRLNPFIASLLLERIIKKEKITLVHANSSAAAFASARVCKRLNIPWVYTAHGWLSAKDLNQGIEQANRVICVSNFLHQEILRRTTISPANLVTLYNGVNLQKFTSIDNRGILRRELGLQPTDYVIGIVSRIFNANSKGHQDLLTMLSTYPETKKWRLLIVGKGKHLPLLKYKVWRLGLSDRVIFTGHRTDVHNVLSAMDVFVLPSRFETFGLVLAEAMAMGKPAVAYQVGGTKEIIDDGVNGFLVPKSDWHELYNKLNILYENRQFIETMGENGRKKVEQLFDSELMVDQLTDLYSEVLREWGERS